MVSQKHTFTFFGKIFFENCSPKNAKVRFFGSLCTAFLESKESYKCQIRMSRTFLGRF
jgi:hypothetical protein